MLLSQPAVNCMNIGEIQVFSNSVNIAKGKTVTQSSMLAAATFPSTNLVDEVFTNFAHTSCNDKGWMQINLGSMQSIDSIKVTNRADCCSGRVIGAKIIILNASGVVVFTSDAFLGKTGQTAPTEGMDGFSVYTITPPCTAAVGSL